ncbi:MAG TPA: hypothetical protein VFG74_00735 [Miltoncostaeaceae bacterium]|jgi:hypothetical protein|nr:hypothetical protein [Miltoncostaeaceae bacterium]
MALQSGGRVARLARAGMVVTGVASVVFLNPSALAFSVVLLAGSIVISRFARPTLDAAVALFFLGHAAGTLIGYANIRAWGPILHLCVPVLVAMILSFGWADRRLPPRSLPLRRAHLTSALGAAVVGSLAIVVGWEVAERLMLQIPGVDIQTDRGDTETDLQLGLLGTILGVLASAVVLRRERRRGGHLGGDGRRDPAYRAPIST